MILKWLVQRFEPDVDYPERTVNELLQQSHWDSATLRREMIGYQMMQRQNGIYQRRPETDWKQVDQLSGTGF